MDKLRICWRWLWFDLIFDNFYFGQITYPKIRKRSSFWWRNHNSKGRNIYKTCRGRRNLGLNVRKKYPTSWKEWKFGCYLICNKQPTFSKLILFHFFINKIKNLIRLKGKILQIEIISYQIIIDFLWISIPKIDQSFDDYLIRIQPFWVSFW